MHHGERLAVCGNGRDDIAAALSAFAEGETPKAVASGQPVAGAAAGVVFVFSGQGPQWWGMGRELLQREPVFRDAIEEIDAILAPLACRRLSPGKVWLLREELSRGEKASRLAETSIAQPAIFALQVALARLFGSWGIEPSAVVGHSVGEVAAAHVSGALSLEDAARVIFERGRTMDLSPGRGRMLAAQLTPEEATGIVRPVADRVSIGAVNGPRSVTLSGDGTALEEIAAELAEREVFHRFVPVRYAFHSPQMDPVREELLRSLARFERRAARLPMFSTVLARAVDGLELDAGYWWRNVRETVYFAPAINGLVDRGFRVFLEIGAHPALANAVNATLRLRSVPGAVVSTLRRREPELESLLQAAGALHVAGIDIDWHALHPDGDRPVDLPTYPWQRERYWHESEGSRERRLDPATDPFLRRDTKRVAPTWETWLDREEMPALADHRVQGRVIFPAAGFLEIVFEAADRHLGARSWTIDDVDFLRSLPLPDHEAPRVEISVDLASSRFSIASASGVEWTVHCTGALRSEGVSPSDSSSLAELRSRVRARRRIHLPGDSLRRGERGRSLALRHALGGAAPRGVGGNARCGFSARPSGGRCKGASGTCRATAEGERSSALPPARARSRPVGSWLCRQCAPRARLVG